ncbi:TROVE domain-containing protein [Actinokineospora bangkokensis]|uniref:RNA-binding protein n=1 Tax=Actinokineospora bangkokensis TaxID=1193682 RepID=A0A1Q9LTX2_9PSEU|nr:TROVE domain-containing protein [Actinokineospora bangkokensis]OLR95424.1 RNA-binding protein [Actinokineospora bangkokensis]
MSKFNSWVKGAVRRRSPVVGELRASGRNHEGGAGFARDLRSELFLFAVSNFVGESSFYESAAQRDERFGALVREAAVSDAEWTARLLGWLRGTANIRTASLVGAVEFARARVRAGLPGMSRQVVGSVLQRADEPGEMLAYCLAAGRAVPKPIKRGIADAVRRLYSERSYLKWDSALRAVRFADVLELTHPKAVDERQGALFARILDDRHGNRVGGHSRALPVLRARAEVDAGRLRQLIDTDRERASAVIRSAGLTWEALSGVLPGRMDAAVWEAVVPRLGYMALLRNLRNFDEAGVSDAVVRQVIGRLTDPEEVARSRQLPLRFLSAHRATRSLRWAAALERALDLSLANVPALSGRTLVLVDRSGSMFRPLARRSTVTAADAAAVFGTALAVRAERADLVEFGWTSAAVRVRRRDSVLRMATERFHDLGGTDTRGALVRHLRAHHERVVLITDEQHHGGESPLAVVPARVPVYTWNLVGYRFGHGGSGTRDRHVFGGLSDAAFGLVPLLEAGRRADWPF